MFSFNNMYFTITKALINNGGRKCAPATSVISLLFSTGNLSTVGVIKVTPRRRFYNMPDSL